MSDLTDAGLWQAHRDADLLDVLGQPGPAALYRRVLDEVRHHRAVVATHPTGPDQPATAWDEGFEAGTEHTVALSAPPGANGPVDPPSNPYTRAREAQATAPAADDDAHA